MTKIVIQPSVYFGFGLPWWLGLNLEKYGCRGLGHHGLKFCIELIFIELMLCVGRRYEEG